jgi:hypothetical protein
MPRRAANLAVQSVPLRTCTWLNYDWSHLLGFDFNYWNFALVLRLEKKSGLKLAFATSVLAAIAGL